MQFATSHTLLQSDSHKVGQIKVVSHKNNKQIRLTEQLPTKIVLAKENIKNILHGIVRSNLLYGSVTQPWTE
jgi:hypothetical protein